MGIETVFDVEQQHTTSNLFSISLPTQAQLLEYSSAQRYLKETGGLLISGIPVSTLREDLGLLIGMNDYAAKNPNTSITFTVNGKAVVLTSAQAQAIYATVQEFIQTCRTAEGQLAAQINSGAITTNSDIDTVYAALTTSF